jgi:hypothetical protein
MDMAPPKLSLEDLRKIAIDRGGKLLSNDYINGHAKKK